MSLCDFWRYHNPPPRTPPVFLQVSGAMDFGCFVELLGFQKKFEGLVHVNAISKARTGNAKELVQRGQTVWIKARQLA